MEQTKIKLSYQEDERETADKLTEQLKKAGFKVTKSDRYDPFLHTYLATKKRQKPHK